MSYMTTKPLAPVGLGPAPVTTLNPGMSMLEMAKLERKEHGSKWGLGRKAGVPPKMRDSDKANGVCRELRADQLIEFLRDNPEQTKNQICEHFGISPTTVRDVLQVARTRAKIKCTKEGCFGGYRHTYSLAE